MKELNLNEIFTDIHRHDEFSFFDGFGKPSELAKIAKEKGMKCLSTSNHGNISSLVQTWLACKEEGLKPILGCEVYYQPSFNKENPKRGYYHLCLFAKNLQGYKNLCHLLSDANIENFYFKAIVDNKLLKKYKEGIICTTACIQSYFSQSIVEGKVKNAEKALEYFKKLFKEDLYVEIQPYRLREKGLQEKVDKALMKIADKLNIRCILTSDSHYGRKEDFPTYLKMHQIGKTTLDVVGTYKERYMPTGEEMLERFVDMYKNKERGIQYIKNIKHLTDKVEEDILGQLEINLPKISKGENSYKLLKQKIKEGLIRHNKWNIKKYRERALMELDVIHYHDFDDYFLMVQDYVNWARKRGIAVGQGRGSACNCLIAWLIGITDVDSIKYNLDFSRFMRKDKKKMPKQYWASLVNIA